MHLRIPMLLGKHTSQNTHVMRNTYISECPRYYVYKHPRIPILLGITVLYVIEYKYWWLHVFFNTHIM